MTSRPSLALPLSTLCATLLASACAVPKKAEPEYGVALDVHYGESYLDNGWGDYDDQQTGGVNVDWGPERTGLRLEAGFWGSQDDSSYSRNGTSPGNPPTEVSITEEARVLELSGGARYVFDTKSRVYPYVGLGLAWVMAHFELTPGSNDFDNLNDIKTDDSDSVLGYYGQVGVYGDLGEGFRVGLQYRMLVGPELSEGDFEADSDYERLTIFIGYGF